jgi:hypothetical protein
MNRALCLTEKVKTPFGSCYAHVAFDGGGNVLDVSFSSPGKFRDSTVDNALHALAAALTIMLADIRTCGRS